MSDRCKNAPIRNPSHILSTQKLTNHCDIILVHICYLGSSNILLMEVSAGKMQIMNINKSLAEYFLSDSYEYLKRYEALKVNSTHLGNRSKLLVDLMFALECLLKAVIFFESSTSEKETYSNIRTHCFSKLYKLISQESKDVYNSCIKENLEEYQIKIRYEIESQIDFRNEQGVLDIKYYNTIANPEWLEKVCEEIKCFCRYVGILTKSNLETINFSDIDTEDELKKVGILRGLRSYKTT